MNLFKNRKIEMRLVDDKPDVAPPRSQEERTRDAAEEVVRLQHKVQAVNTVVITIFACRVGEKIITRILR